MKHVYGDRGIFLNKLVYVTYTNTNKIEFGQIILSKSTSNQYKTAVIKIIGTSPISKSKQLSWYVRILLQRLWN